MPTDPDEPEVPPLTDEEEREVSTVPLEDDEGNEVTITQQNVGVDRELGGGEFPDPDTPPSGMASGSD